MASNLLGIGLQLQSLAHIAFTKIDRLLLEVQLLQRQTGDILDSFLQ